jgi:hypothetical protein
MIALVQLGMGPAEDFARLHRRMCQLRRPAPRIRRIARLPMTAFAGPE